MPKRLKTFFKYFSENIAYIFSGKKFVLESHYFDDEWNKKINNEDNPRFVAISKVIRGGSSILDLGCGNGDLMVYLRDKNKLSDVRGMDESAVGIQKCRDKGFKAEVLDLNNLGSTSIEPADYVILSEVIEHIRDCEKVMTDCKKIYKKAVIITIPNAGYIWYRLRYLFGRFPIDEHFPPNFHIRFWTKRDFIIWADQLGYNLTAIHGCGGFTYLWKYFPSLFARNILYYLE